MDCPFPKHSANCKFMGACHSSLSPPTPPRPPLAALSTVLQNTVSTASPWQVSSPPARTPSTPPVAPAPSPSPNYISFRDYSAIAFFMGTVFFVSTVPTASLWVSVIPSPASSPAPPPGLSQPLITSLSL